MTSHGANLNPLSIKNLVNGEEIRNIVNLPSGVLSPPLLYINLFFHGKQTGGPWSGYGVQVKTPFSEIKRDVGISPHEKEDVYTKIETDS